MHIMKSSYADRLFCVGDVLKGRNLKIRESFGGLREGNILALSQDQNFVQCLRDVARRPHHSCEIPDRQKGKESGPQGETK